MSKVNTFLKVMKNEPNIIPKLIFLNVTRKGILNLISDKLYLKSMYYFQLGKKLDLGNPKTFNEKLQWLKIYDRRPQYTKLVDKYLVRDYISKTIGEQYLIPLIDVYDDVKDIDWDMLPNRFVLKCTHGSGCNIICEDKKKLDIETSIKKLNKWMKRNYYFHAREWSYRNVKPRIICERYMIDESGFELKDYKFMCFNGKVKCSFVCLNRNSATGLNVDFYDLDWKPMPFERHFPNSGIVVPKPKNYNKMIEFAEKLSKGIPFVRVDFYEANGALYFGELTFFPGAGFEEFTPEKYDYLLGSWIELP
jgi:hypothetical protein